MKIIEVRDGFIKFEADSSILLSSFVKIEGSEKDYVAQVIQVKNSGEKIYAYAKILFLLNESEILPYDKTEPSDSAEIFEYTSEFLKNSVSVSHPVIVGKTLNGANVVVDASAFDKKMLVSADDDKSNNLIVRNLVKQFENLGKNVLIIDSLGIISAKKYKAGVDFKLPLNTSSLEFIYQECLSDATEDSKTLIVEIFKDLSEYSKTVRFLPFKILKNIVDDMVDKSHIFKLLVLKNKLNKFEKLGYFANESSEIDKIKDILKSKCAIIDISGLDTAFQGKYINFVYESIKQDSELQVFWALSNVVPKKTIKDVILNQNVKTALITHSKFKYLNEIKDIFDNFIIVPSFTNNEIFKIYNTFLDVMKKDAYLITGEATNYVPIISSLVEINELPKYENDDELEKVIKENSENEKTGQDNTEDSLIIESIDEKSEQTIEELAKTLDVPDEIDMFSDDENSDDSFESEILNELMSEEDFDEDDIQEYEEDDSAEEQAELIIETEHKDEPLSQDLSDEVIEAEYQEQSELTDAEASESIEEIDDTITLHDESDDSLTEYEEVSDYDEEISENSVVQDEISDEVQNETESVAEIKETDETEAADNELLEFAQGEVSIELGDEIDLDLTMPDASIEEDGENEDSGSESVEEYSTDVHGDITEDETADETEVIPLDAEDDYGLDEIVELEPGESSESDILIDLDESNDDLSDEVDEQIVKEVDKVYTTIKDDDFSDSDLDFIDELNSEDSPVLEEISDNDSLLEEVVDNEGILEEETYEPPKEEQFQEPEILEKKEASTPIVPVYEAEIPQEDMVLSDPIEQGDTVVHAKYGTGVVEKMIKYGNKTLFAINFDNIGRRLLDPTLTELKKV